jgi:hypothetical protein
VKEIYKGEECYIYRNWYEFVDHKLAKRLAKYKICGCLAETFTKPIEMGQIITKNINPIFNIKQ